MEEEVRLLLGWSMGRSVCLSVCHNFLKDGKVPLPCSYIAAIVIYQMRGERLNHRPRPSLPTSRSHSHSHYRSRHPAAWLSSTDLSSTQFVLFHTLSSVCHICCMIRRCGANFTKRHCCKFSNSKNSHLMPSRPVFYYLIV